MKIGERLLTVMCGAQQTIRIAVPFIKTHALERVLLAIPNHVEVTCIARMRAEDIATGVCDLEVFDQFKNRRKSTFLIHPHLHAKLFAADANCLVGSANLSQTALGWRTPSNIEILVELDAKEHGLDEWWDELIAQSIEATTDMRDALRDEAAKLRISGMPISRPETDQGIIEDDTIWVPECPRWTGLWEIYSGDEEQLPTSALASAKSDLTVLGLPPGLNQAGFRIAVKTSFRHTQIYQHVDQLSREGLNDVAAHNLLIEQCDVAPKDAERRWQLLKHWLSDLYPDEFRIESNQEILLKGKSF